jgi:hypothetical protein
MISHLIPIVNELFQWFQWFQWVVSVMGSYDQHSAAFEKLYAEAMKQGIYDGSRAGI